MDSDCFPVNNPDSLFKSEPFKSTGLVLWPDFWFPSESPFFFNIAGIPAPPIYERAAIESSVMMYSKRNHESSLLLAAYYNYHGPDYYYSLQSQGNIGEGEKETFLWSVVVMKEPYYTVTSQIRALGYHTKSHEWRGSAMAQSDPIQDYNMTESDHQTALQDPTKFPRPFFVHANHPRLDPGHVFENSSFGRPRSTWDSDGSLRRIWHEDAIEATSFFGFDLERRLRSSVKNVACTYEKVFVNWKGKKDVCVSAEEYWDAVFGV